MFGKFFRVVAVQRNDLEVPGVAVAAHGARGQSGASDAPGCEYSVSRILLLLFIIRSEVISVLFFCFYIRCSPSSQVLLWDYV